MTNFTDNSLNNTFLLQTGVQVHDLLEFTTYSDSMERAQGLLECGTYTHGIDVSEAYTERVENRFAGVYVMEIDTAEEYTRFVYKLLLQVQPELNLKAFPTIHDWQANRIMVDGRERRLASWLRKQGVNAETLDFYSAQDRRVEQREVVFTISDMPDHIAGMSQYANGFHSCMDTSEPQSVRLAGALHDNKLFVGMLHEHPDELADMDGFLQARVLFRLVTVEGVQHLIPTKVYGESSMRSDLNLCLMKLAELNIHSMDIIENRQENNLGIIEPANGGYSYWIYDEVEVEREEELEVEGECPTCEGSRVEEAYSGMIDDMVEVECQTCRGEGRVVGYIFNEISVRLEVEQEKELRTYEDNYAHLGSYISIDVNREKFNAHNARYNGAEKPITKKTVGRKYAE